MTDCYGASPTGQIHEPADVDLVYVGSIGGMERNIVEHESTLRYRGLPAAAVRGRGIFTLIRNGATLAVGTIAALSLLREIQPSCILGTGGYVCVPLFLAARVLGIPTVIYLPDIVPGLAVKFLSRIATQVACSVEDSLPYFGGKHGPSKAGKHPPVVTGYPVRSELIGLDQKACCTAFGLDKSQPVLIVYGGSRGARSINRAIEALLPDVLEMTQVIHICGREGDDVWLQEAAQQLEPQLQARYRLFPYLEEGASLTMTKALGAADLALCRSGASILGELPVLGLPSVLVPYPYVNQDDNADYLVRQGVAVKVKDEAMFGDGRPHDGELFQQLKRLLKTHPQQRQTMKEACRHLARPDAAMRLAETLCRLATRRGSL